MSEEKQNTIRVVEKSSFINTFGELVPRLQEGVAYKFVKINNDIGLIIDKNTGNIINIKLDDSKNIQLTPAEEERLLNLLSVRFHNDEGFSKRVLDYDAQGIDNYEDEVVKSNDTSILENQVKSSEIRGKTIYYIIVLVAVMVVILSLAGVVVIINAVNQL